MKILEFQANQGKQWSLGSAIVIAFMSSSAVLSPVGQVMRTKSSSSATAAILSKLSRQQMVGGGMCKPTWTWQFLITQASPAL